MNKRALARALSAAVISVVVSSGAIVGTTTSPAQAAPAEPTPAPAPAAEELLDLDLLSVLTGLPLLSGTGAIGDPLALTKPVFGLLTPLLEGLVDTDVTWLCNGSVIPGTEDLLQFVPTEAQAGCEMAARTVSSLLGFLPLSLVTDVIRILPLPGAEAPVATTAASIAGTPKVGQVLTLTDPVWSTAGVTNTYAWQRAGAPIPGATGKTYTVTAADAGKQVTAKVTGTKDGTTGTSTSNALLVAAAELEELVATAAPSVSGTGKVGRLLQIDPGTWLGGVVEPLFAYQWYSTSGAIPGATSRTYAPTLADAGRPLAATVSATLPGFLGGLGVTNVVKVAKAGSRTALSKASGRLVTLRVTPGAAHPTGKVRLMEGKRTLRTYRLGAADNGRRTVRVPKLGAGTHRLRAVYLGNAALTRSTSKVLRLTTR